MEERLVGAPEGLRERILAAVRGGSRESGIGNRTPPSPDGAVLDSRFPLSALRAAAEELLQRAKSAPPTHDTALTLLAADALITLACEAEAGSE